MFLNCSLLYDITPLKYWDVSKGTNFIGMFDNCFSLNDYTPLKNWNLDENAFNSIFN